MAALENPYRKLPGSGVGAFQRVSLYLGQDHLLMVSSSGYSETYKRFYFRDIQSFEARKSIRGKVWNILWSVLGAVFTSIGLAFDGVAMMIWLGIAGSCLAALVVNFALGPSCIFHVRTAVQSCPIASLNRFRRASHLMRQLRPLIEAAQPTRSSEPGVPAVSATPTSESETAPDAPIG